MNFKTIRKTVGTVLCLEAAFMLPPLGIAIADGERAVTTGFLAAIAAVLAIGLALALVKRSSEPLAPRDGCVTVALAWIIISLFGAIPFYVSGAIPNPVDAIFETISGFTTTGATILDDVESAPRAILLWRSITNWIGGMGVLVFLLALVPVAREGGSVFLLRAEFPGPMAGKLVPRMQQSAKLLYELYIAFTLLQIILLSLGSMPLFDAVNISLSTVSTGGFAVRNDSLMSYGSYSQAVTLVFMTLCSISFSIYYCLIAWELIRLRKSHELRLFAIIVIAAAGIIAIDTAGSLAKLGASLFDSLFMTVSIISTTSFFAVEPSTWSAFGWAVLAALMITGPMAGSTGGGMKLSRVMIFWKSAKRALVRTVTPGATRLVIVDGEVVDEDTVSSVNSFAVVYFLTLVFTALVLALDGIDFGLGMKLAISSIGNIGCGIDAATIGFKVSELGALSKTALCFDMFLGRLEIFPLLVLFAPSTWRK